MNINKDGKTLVFSDEEIENETNGEKKVFVAKRINGKESHIKIEKKKNNEEEKVFEPKEWFDFTDEIVIGVNNNTKKNKRTKQKKENQKKIKKDKNNFNKQQNVKKRKNAPYKKRKRKINKKIITIFSIILLIAAIIILAFTAPIFNITKIEVLENDIVSSDTIISLSGLKKGENIFKFNSNIINKIKENQYIDTVQIKRVLPGTVKLTVQERQVKYQINVINSYAYLDKNGYILENSTIKKDVPIIVGMKISENDLINQQRLINNDLAKLGKINKIIDASKAVNIENIITEINVENENNYYIYIESKQKKIYVGDMTNLTNKMLYIKKIIENEEGKKGTIYVNGDISSGFKPYFREE